MSTALSCHEDPPRLCYSLYSYCATSLRSVWSCALICMYGRQSLVKHQPNGFSGDPQLHYLPFPVDDPVPLSYFGLGTKLEFMSTRKRLTSLASDGTSSSSSSNKSGIRNRYSSGSSSSSTNMFSSESSNNTFSTESSTLSYMSSSGLPFETQVNLDETELEAQRFMSIDIFDYDEVGGGYEDQQCIDDRIIVSKKYIDIMHPIMLGSDGRVYCDIMKGCLLLAEHKILCQAFVDLTSCLRIEHYKEVLPCIVNLLSKIWTQSEWRSTFSLCEDGLTHLILYGNFLEMIYPIVKFCENELKRIIVDESTKLQSDNTYMVSFLRLILPLILQWLQCIHALWKGQVACDLPEEPVNAKSPMSYEDSFEHNEIRKLLEEIRECGYNIIGLSISLKGAFSEFLDSSSFSDTFMEYLFSMEFRHLRKLIHLVFLPLVKSCSHELWKDWMLNLLGPLLIHCEDVLYHVWFNHMHHRQIPVSRYFGKLAGSTENVERSVENLLVEFTREVSDLLGVISSSESNIGMLHDYSQDANKEKMTILQDLESISSSSLIGYLLLNNCFGRLRMSLVGHWVDDEATTKAIPFYSALVQLAGATKDQRLRLFVLDELLPSLIRRLDDQLPSAARDLFSKLNSSTTDVVSKDLLLLCQEVYNYLSTSVCTQSEDTIGEDKSSTGSFTCWLENKKKELRSKSSCTAPKEFEGGQVKWNWEFEDEFQRYLPVYISMLKEVDDMDDSFEHEELDRTELLQKLKPEFRAKYAINSSEHHHLTAISRMRKRKYFSMTDVKRYGEIYEILRELITLEPYIKGSDGTYDVIKRLEENLELSSTFDFGHVKQAVHVLHSMLQVWEPRFHPLIREGHKDLLLWVAGELTKAKEIENFEPLVPHLRDFPSHLIPYALLYIETTIKNSMYDKALEQIHLHEEYDNYLASASGELDSYIYEFVPIKDDFSVEDADPCVVPHQFAVLDNDLIKLSLKRRAEIVHMHRQVCTYSECLRRLLENELLKGHLTSLMNRLKTEDLFFINSDCDNRSCFQENKHFSELVEKFSHDVFGGHSLPKHYVIRGIIDFRMILLQKHRTWEVYEEVVSKVCDDFTAHVPQFWRDTQQYKHSFYDVIREPLKKIFVG